MNPNQASIGAASLPQCANVEAPALSYAAMLTAASSNSSHSLSARLDSAAQATVNQRSVEPRHAGRFEHPPVTLPTAKAAGHHENGHINRQLPSPNAQVFYQRQFNHSAGLSPDDRHLLKSMTAKTIKQNHGVGQVKRLLEKPSVDFMHSLEDLTLYVQILSDILDGKVQPDKWNVNIIDVKNKWTESAHAFYSIYDRVDLNGAGFIKRLALLCNRWSRTQPVQPAVCAAAKWILHRYRTEYGENKLHKWFMDRTNNPGRDISLLINAFSRQSIDMSLNDGIATLALLIIMEKRQLASPKHYDPQSLAIMVNGLSKWLHVEPCRLAGIVLAQQVTTRLRIPGYAIYFDPQHLANLINGLSKWPDDEFCGNACIALANVVSARLRISGGAQEFTPQNLANLVNGLSKWPREEACKQTGVAVANVICRLLEAHGDQRPFTALALEIIVKSMRKWPHEPPCQEAMRRCASQLAIT